MTPGGLSQRGSGVPEVALHGRGPGPVPLRQERRNRYRREDADDDHDHQKLDEGEAPLVPLYLMKLPEPLGEKVKHTLSFSLGCFTECFYYR